MCFPILIYAIISQQCQPFINVCFRDLHTHTQYLVVDTQMIIGGSNKVQISPEEYVMAAITLYVDIINIFMYILQILQSVSNE